MAKGEVPQWRKRREPLGEEEINPGFPKGYYPEDEESGSHAVLETPPGGWVITPDGWVVSLSAALEGKRGG